MNVLWRILSVAALAVSAVILFLSIVSVRKEQRVRPGLDILRLGITLGTTVLMARLLGVRTSEALMGLGFLVGLLLGVYEGMHLRLRFLGKNTFARRTILGVLAWGLGVIVVQGAGVIGRIGLADFGLAMSFLGIGQVLGLLTGRWHTVVAARRAVAGAAAMTVAALLVLAGVLLPAVASPAVAADAVDIRDVMAGGVPGVAVEVRGNGWWYGASLSLTFTNETGAPVEVAVPLGLQFVPAAEGTQTMIAAGGETIEVPALGAGQTYVTEIQAFCGQKADSQPYPSDVFSAGEVVTGDLAVLVRTINQSGSFDEVAQDAVWSLTDDYDISNKPAATALVAAAGLGITGPPSGQEGPFERGEESDHHHLTAGKGTRTAAVGFAGAAALLVSTLAGAGASPASVAASLRGKGWRGWRDLAAGGGGGGAVPDWFDAGASLAHGRAGAALEQVPEVWRGRVAQTLVERLEAEQTGRLVEAVHRAVGAIDPAADPGEVLRSNAVASGLLGRVPAEIRSRIEEKVLAGIQDRQVGAAAEEAARALRRDGAVGVLRAAIERRDGTGAQRVMAALGEKDGAEAWARATRGLEVEAGSLEYPPPAPAGTVPEPARLDLAAALDTETDLKGLLGRGGEVDSVLSRLPAGTRAQAEGRLLERLETERVVRWVGKLRLAAGTRPAGGSILDVPEVQRLLDALPPGVRDEVGAAAARVLDGEAVASLAGEARRLVEQDGAVELLRSAIGLGDGDRADAIMNAVIAGLDTTGKADLDRLVSRATEGGAAALEGLVRRGAGAGPVDLIEHLAGEPDLLAAARRVGGVEEVLRQAGSLRPQVEAQLAGNLNIARLNGTVGRAVEVAGLGKQAAADVLSTARELPRVRGLVGKLPPESQQEAYRLLEERLETEGLEAAVEQVGGALRLDRAEAALRQAAAAGSLDAADAALAGLSAEEAGAIETSALRG